MSRWWPRRVPLRLRVFFRSAFLLLALATLAFGVFEMREEKQLSYRNYREVFERNTQQIAARLQHPSGQLALLNPTLPGAALTPLRPLLLPFSAIDFDDRTKAQQAAEMAGCLVQYPNQAQLCVSIGNNPIAGGFIYAVGSFASGPLVMHERGDTDLTHAHRLLVDVALRGRTYHWIAPLEAGSRHSAVKSSARLSGFALDPKARPAGRPDKEFRGWLWQDSRCLAVSRASVASECAKRSFFAVRLPVALLSEERLDPSGAAWPPKDLAQVQVRVRALGPSAQTVLFDSNQPGAIAPFALSDLRAQLLPGESLRIRRLNAPHSSDVISLSFESDSAPHAPPVLSRLIARLPVDSNDQLLSARQVITTPVGEFEVLLNGDPHSADANLSLLAGRLSLFLGGMLAAIAVTWAAIEYRIIHRITLLTRRAAGVKQSVDDAGEQQLDLHGLRGGDELGLLADVLADFLHRINEDAKRERLRLEQERSLWHAVGHEIMAPLQSLSALHQCADDPSLRYVHRMRQAVRVLYGCASPSDAFLSAALQMKPLDIRAFLQTVADNAAHAGIAQVEFDGTARPVIVRADEYSLEDVVTHVLSNADRYRTASTPIRISLREHNQSAEVHIYNRGSCINPPMLRRIFDYGVSDCEAGGNSSHRGQGLFVAQTYMAKMGGTIEAANVEDGVEFVLRLAVA
jgi:signal transduction histidine kinase